MKISLELGRWSFPWSWGDGAFLGAREMELTWSWGDGAFLGAG